MTLSLVCSEIQAKIACNTIYGACGCINCVTPSKELAATVTAVGRADIQTVIDLSGQIFNVKNGYRGNARVVYGDTDSAFVSFADTISAEVVGDQEKTIAEGIRLTNILVVAVNDKMKKPKKLAFEKVYLTWLGLSPKHYAGMMYTSPTSTPYMDIKGLQCVRRNGCELVRANVKTILDYIVQQGDVPAAGAYVRSVILDINADKIPLEQYIMRQTLRQGKQESSKPLSVAQLRVIRNAIGTTVPDESKVLLFVF